MVTRPASGLVTALESIIEAAAGVWVAHGAGAADKIVACTRDGVDGPSAVPRPYRLRYVWLTDHESRAHYDGFARQGFTG